MPSEAFATALLQPDSTTAPGLKDLTPRRFAVYKNNVVLGLVRALEANFPAIRNLLGRTYFAGLARDFARLHPPQSPLMFTYGDALPAYLGAQPDLAGYPYLADVATLENLMRKAYHADDTLVLEPTALAAVNPAQLGEIRLKPHPALHLLQSSCSVVAITQANRTEIPSPIEKPLQPEWAIVTRPAFDVMLTSVAQSQFAFVKSLCAGLCLAESAEVAFEQDPEFDLPAALNVILARGMFSTLEQQ
jgi:Putative DNA-binding domain